MKDRLQKALTEEFPGVFKHHGGDVRLTCMGWGIECDDGWFLIIWNLCKVLEPLGAVASQVKEKFGTMRFYLEPFSGGEENWTAANAAVSKAESESAMTCEACGRPGRRVNPRGWIKTMCERCEP